MGSKCVCVVVLGDIGRSPRMQYHSLSFAKEGYDVDVVGYSGSEPIKELSEHPKVKIRYLAPCPDFQQYLPRSLAYVSKIIWQSITLLFALLYKRRSHHVIVQNPPAIPALAVCWFYSLVMVANYVIDWHNYGHTVLALTVGQEHMFVRISIWFESYFGRRATASLCVTKAMKVDLEKKWGISAVTLYDRPPDAFRPISILESHQLFVSLANQYPTFRSNDSSTSTIFTEVLSSGEAVWRKDRPGLIVSSTSWTEDEDFSILLSALQEYEEARCDEGCELPALVCVITGKGPLKEHYCQLMKEKTWKHIQVVTPWLKPEDYPHLLASANLGICLHTSSSGLDLPMKVVDMFGCGLPVCAYNFSCLNELVKHNINGWKFDDASQLADQLQTWFRGFPCSEVQLERDAKFREELKIFQKLRWHENWTFNALPLFSAR
ncbi:chitobiosyldiphosphodolichol beta-mannosyltransferase isoform X1 [Periplaneta americana]|uniref:chitobiosyldiphosphodolichol beta-mannosyltransferase isoform X1 n=1 Tax=Periplaneta americana TaxID=6978 RepID=UPI0037E91CB0